MRSIIALAALSIMAAAPTAAFAQRDLEPDMTPSAAATGTQTSAYAPRASSTPPSADQYLREGENPGYGWTPVGDCRNGVCRWHKWADLETGPTLEQQYNQASAVPQGMDYYHAVRATSNSVETYGYTKTKAIDWFKAGGSFVLGTVIAAKDGGYYNGFGNTGPISSQYSVPGGSRGGLPRR